MSRNAECACGCGKQSNGVKRYLPYHHLDAARRKRKVVERWKQDANGCWIWQLKTTKQGYARDRFNGRQCLVHKKHYEDKYGPVPDGRELDHTCEVKACVNPDHLEPVPHTINVRRGARAKLTLELARQIRSLYSQGNTNQYELAALFGVSQFTIQCVVNFRTWKETA